MITGPPPKFHETRDILAFAALAVVTGSVLALYLYNIDRR